ncbi:hypothetical protein FNW02_11530 [Komarekiella sp. 'clone 1']|uniref:Uncharacterized protein n=1 Tax=Komarekiella delphini-convector SJRDD-AB1 TaxID=2593771 RepID=A0AA40SWV2_9NOST|nr:hypothetical protein [Komarekiella delphini-convector]MBD6616450.1 hypothetical protein [Komarekiella delphini-convector SJRDD-AB1]
MEITRSRYHTEPYPQLLQSKCQLLGKQRTEESLMGQQIIEPKNVQLATIHRRVPSTPGKKAERGI